MPPPKDTISRVPAPREGLPGRHGTAVQTVTSETLKFAREKAGEHAVDEVVGAIPGLGRFV